MKNFNIYAISNNGELIIVTNRFHLNVRNIHNNQTVYECRRNPEMSFPFFVPDTTLFFFTTSDGYIEVHDYIANQIVHTSRFANSHGYPVYYDNSNYKLIIWVGSSKELIVLDFKNYTECSRIFIPDFSIQSFNKDPFNDDSYIMVTQEFSSSPTTTIRKLTISKKISYEVIYNSKHLWSSSAYNSYKGHYYYVKNKSRKNNIYVLNTKSWNIIKLEINELKKETNIHIKIQGVINNQDVLLTSVSDTGWKTGLYNANNLLYKEISNVGGFNTYASNNGNCIAINFNPNKNKVLIKKNYRYQSILL